MWAVNMGISAYTAVQTGDILGFAGGIVGGAVFGALGKGLSLGLSARIGDAAWHFAGGALGGAIEFGMGGFGAGLGAALASGESFKDSLKAGGFGAAIGAATGAVIQGSYVEGWQDVLHGYSIPELGAAQAGFAFQNRNFMALPRIDTAMRTRTEGKYGLWLHGTDKLGSQGINRVHSLYEDSFVTRPLARDPITGKLAFRLNPNDYARFTGIQPPKGEYLALAVGHAEYIGTAAGGQAPEYVIQDNFAVSYKNRNRY